MSIPRLSLSLSQSQLIPQLPPAASSSQLFQLLPANAEKAVSSSVFDSPAPLHSSEATIATSCFSKPLPRLPLESLIDALDKQFTLEVDRVSQRIREAYNSIEAYKTARNDRLPKQRESLAA